ncbi:hypothetical protein GCM10022221_62660 [Actinocorallia aurea]
MESSLNAAVLMVLEGTLACDAEGTARPGLVAEVQALGRPAPGRGCGALPEDVLPARGPGGAEPEYAGVCGLPEWIFQSAEQGDGLRS